MSAQLNAALNHPARLQIAAALAQVDEIEFATLREIVEVSDSVLSKHLATLTDDGLAKVKKATLGGRQRTWAHATARGRKAFRDHVQALQDMVAAAQAAAE